MLKELFRWLDAHPGSFWALATFATALAGIWIFWGFTRHGTSMGSRWHAAITGLVLLTTLLAWRWPPLLGVRELNPDEGQFIAGAITLGADPVFWRSVDGTTSGPLNFYVLLPTHWLGIPQDFFNARLTGLLLIWGTLWAGYALFRRAYGNAIGLVAVVPGLAFFSGTIDPDFIHYTSEHLSLCLMMVSGWLLWKARGDTRTGHGFPRVSWVLAGIFMGMLPWAKLQSSLIAAALALFGTVLAFTRTDLPWAQRLREVAVLAAASLSITATFLGMILFTGQWEHFYRGYLENNLIYASSTFTIPEAIEKFSRAARLTGGYPVFLAGPIFILGLGTLACAAKPGRPHPLAWSGAFLTLTSIITVLAPRQGFQHYLLYMVPPLMWWSAAVLAGLHASLPDARRRITLVLAFILVGGGLSISLRSSYSPSYMYGHFLESWRNPHREANRLIRQHRQPGDRIAVWGWDNQVYVETQLPQATRESHSTRQLWDSPQRDSYYRPRYLADLAANSPAFFVDAVGPDAFHFNDREESGHETFEELRLYIAEHYTLIDDSGPLRVYLRKDRVPVS